MECVICENHCYITSDHGEQLLSCRKMTKRDEHGNCMGFKPTKLAKFVEKFPYDVVYANAGEVFLWCNTPECPNNFEKRCNLKTVAISNGACANFGKLSSHGYDESIEINRIAKEQMGNAVSCRS